MTATHCDQKSRFFYVLVFFALAALSICVAFEFWRSVLGLPAPPFKLFLDPLKCSFTACVFREPNTGMLMGFFLTQLIIWIFFVSIYILLSRQRARFAMIKKCILFFCIGVFCILFFGSQSRILQLYLHFQKATAHKDGLEKISVIYPRSIQFAQEVKQTFKEWHNAEFLTDAQMSFYEGMTAQRFLAYFLYPVIRLRVHDPVKPVDAVVIYCKKQPAAELLPKGYSVVYQMDDKALVALKDDGS